MDFNRQNIFQATSAKTAVWDAGLRAYMLKVYNFMATGVLLTGIISLISFKMAVTLDSSGAILEFKPKTFVIEQPCPEFVPMIEMDDINSDEITDVATGYLQPLLKQKIHSLILGCSHYPLITPLLTEILPSGVKLIDPAESLSLKFKLFMDSKTNNFSKKKNLFDLKFLIRSLKVLKSTS